MLFIVSPAKRVLFDALTGALAPERGVDVIVDRRLHDRRHGDDAHGGERRRAGRRQRPIEDAEIREYGWTVVRLT